MLKKEPQLDTCRIARFCDTATYVLDLSKTDLAFTTDYRKTVARKSSVIPRPSRTLRREPKSLKTHFCPYCTNNYQ